VCQWELDCFFAWERLDIAASSAVAISSAFGDARRDFPGGSGAKPQTLREFWKADGRAKGRMVPRRSRRNFFLSPKADQQQPIEPAIAVPCLRKAFAPA